MLETFFSNDCKYIYLRENNISFGNAQKESMSAAVQFVQEAG
jgi:hypothetical protein